MPTDALTRIDRSIKFPRIVLAQSGVKSQPFQSQARIPSHEISEKWELQPLYYYMYNGEVFPGESVRFDVRFLHKELPIGESNLLLTRTVASVMTCWFHSHTSGQKLGREFAARTYMRAHEISRMIGWDPLYAHAYYFLTENELSGGFDYSNTDLPVYESFRHIGLRRDFSPPAHLPWFGIHSSASTGSGNLNEHGAFLRDVYNNCLQSWKGWFYSLRHRGEATTTIDLVEAEIALNLRHDSARKDLMSQLDQVFGLRFKDNGNY